MFQRVLNELEHPERERKRQSDRQRETEREVPSRRECAKRFMWYLVTFSWSNCCLSILLFFLQRKLQRQTYFEFPEKYWSSICTHLTRPYNHCNLTFREIPVIFDIIRIHFEWEQYSNKQGGTYKPLDRLAFLKTSILGCLPSGKFPPNFI